MSKIINKGIAVLLVFIILIINTDITFAQYSTNFKNITIRDGLSQSTVQALFQDSKGYMWLGTNDGLNRYNGDKIKVYKSDDKENTIAGNYILNIIEDENKNIWVSTVNGLSKINMDTGEIKNYYKGEKNGNLSDDFVNTTFITKDGSILVGTANGLNIYDEEMDKFKPILNEENSLTSQDIKCMEQDGNGNVWIGTRSGVNKVNIKNNSVEKYHYENNTFTILADAYGHVWISVAGKGVYKINIDRWEVKRYEYVKEDENSIPSNNVKYINQDKSGNVWLATEGGLAKYLNKSDRFQIYKNKSYDQNSLLSDFTYSVMEDQGGLIWVGTYSGVSVLDPNNKIEHYKHNPFDENSLSYDVVHGIYEDDDGLIWVGTQSNGLNIINRDTEEITRVSEGKEGNNLISNNIKVITGKGNKIWIGTREGLNEIDKESNTIKAYTSEDNIAGNNIKSLFLDDLGYLWIGTPEGLSLLNTSDNTIVDLTHIFENLGIKDTYVEDIYQDKEGNYWIGMFLGGGLLRIDAKTKNIEVFEIEELKIESNNVDSVRSITDDKNGNLWIGTSFGLVKLNKDSKKVTNYTQYDGLSNNTVYGVLIDLYGSPWVSTNNGISMLDIEANTFINLNVNDGIQSNEFNGKAYYRSKRGELFFGGINGLNIFNPDDIAKVVYTPNVVFDYFEVEGTPYSNIDNKVFKHDENMVRIKYFVPNYSDEDISYQYRLDGLSEDWINFDSTQVVFSNLDPGKYSFSIRYVNKAGEISDISTIRFTISPPFWKSNFAIMIYIILLIITSYIIRNRVKTLDTLVNMRTKQLSKEMEKSNKLLKQVIKLERNKNNYFVNLSHELRTPLNIISSIEQLVTEFNKSEEGIEREKLNHYMSIMKRNTKRLLNLINNIIDTNKIEHGSYKINIDKHDAVYIVEEATLGMKDFIESKGIELIIDTDIEEKMIVCDYDEIERCIVNLVSNAAKFTPSGGRIEVTINDLGEKVKITVKDTGVGIDEKFHKSIFDRFNQVVDSSTETKGGSGLGLTITKHIIDLHNGEIFVESKKNEGSTFTIILPADK